MSPKRRITKKEMKEDKLVTFAFRVAEIFQKYTNQILIGAGVAVVVIVLIYFFLSSRASQAKQAVDLLGQANFELKMGNTQQAIFGLDMILRRFPGTKSGKRAAFLLGNAHFQSKEYQLAKTTFEKYILISKEPFLKASAQAGIAQCYLEIGNFASAGESFLEAASLSQGNFLEKGYLFNAAWSFSKTEQKQKAKEIYLKLIDQFPESLQAQKAKLNLAEITETLK